MEHFKIYLSGFGAEDVQEIQLQALGECAKIIHLKVVFSLSADWLILNSWFYFLFVNVISGVAF